MILSLCNEISLFALQTFFTFIEDQTFRLTFSATSCVSNTVETDLAPMIHLCGYFMACGHEKLITLLLVAKGILVIWIISLLASFLH